MINAEDRYDITIISGGQTGVDRAALDVAIALGYPYTGWLPKGRLAEDGPLPDSYVGMKEMPTKNYIRRTEQNVIDSDFTIVICHGMPEGGTKRTIDFCVKHNKPHHVVNLDLDVSQQLDAAWAFIDGITGRRVNFAGPRGSKNPSIYDEARDFIERLIAKLESTL